MVYCLAWVMSALSNQALGNPDFPQQLLRFHIKLYYFVLSSESMSSVVYFWNLFQGNINACSPHTPRPLLSLSKQRKYGQKILRIRSLCCLSRGVCIININFGNIVGDTWAHLNVISARKKINTVEWSKLTWKSNQGMGKTEPKKEKSQSNKNVCTNTIKWGKR